MMLGFGISSPENIKDYKNYTDGFIVGSAVIKSLRADDDKFTNTLKLVSELSSACREDSMMRKYMIYIIKADFFSSHHEEYAFITAQYYSR